MDTLKRIIEENNFAKVEDKLKAADDRGKSYILLQAIASQNLEMVKLAIAQGADPSFVSRSGETPLLFSLNYYNPKIIDYLLSFPVVVAQLNRTTSDNPMIVAAENGDGELLEKLVGLGGSLKNKNPSGSTLLMRAVAKGNMEIMIWLLDHGADINEQGSVKGTALMVAVQNRQFEIAKYLYQRGADKNIKDQWGVSAQTYAKDEGRPNLFKSVETVIPPPVKFCGDKLLTELDGKSCDQHMQERIYPILLESHDASQGWKFANAIRVLLEWTRNYDSRPFEQTDYINHWLKYISTFPVESANGVVGLAQLNDIRQDQMVFKFPQTQADPTEWEFVVGSRLNELKPLTPNFVTTYGYFHCNSNGKKIINQSATQICDSRLDPIFSKEFLLLEKVASIGSFIKTVTFENAVSCIVQVLLSLHIANTKLDFTHYDLHGQNVLIEQRDVPNEYLVYVVDGEGFILPRTHVCKIIDFGRSHISPMPRRWEAYWQKDAGFPQYGIIPWVMKRMHDPLNFLGFYLKWANEGKANMEDSVKNVIRSIFRYFRSDQNIEWKENRYLVGEVNANGDVVVDKDILSPPKYKTVLDVARAFRPLLPTIQDLTPDDILYVYSEEFSGRFDPKEVHSPTEEEFIRSLGVYSTDPNKSSLPSTPPSYTSPDAEMKMKSPSSASEDQFMEFIERRAKEQGATPGVVPSSGSEGGSASEYDQFVQDEFMKFVERRAREQEEQGLQDASMQVSEDSPLGPILESASYDNYTEQAPVTNPSPAYDNQRTGMLVTVAPPLPSFQSLQPKLQETKISQAAEPLPVVTEAVCEDLIGNKWSQTNLSFYAERLGISGDDLCNQIVAKQKDVYDFYRSEWEQVGEALQQSPTDVLLLKRLEVAKVNLDAFA